MEIRWGGRVVACHRLAPHGSPAVWDPAHRAAAEAEALGRARRANLRVVPETAVAVSAPAKALVLPAGDWDVDAPDLARYGCGCDGTGA